MVKSIKAAKGIQENCDKSKRKYAKIKQKPENNINFIIKNNISFIKTFLDKLVGSNERNTINNNINANDSNSSGISDDIDIVNENENQSEVDLIKNIQLIFGIFNNEEPQSEDENVRQIYISN